jgi:hypothetical protein
MTHRATKSLNDCLTFRNSSKDSRINFYAAQMAPIDFSHQRLFLFSQLLSSSKWLVSMSNLNLVRTGMKWEKERGARWKIKR